MDQTAVFIGTTTGPNRIMRIMAADHYRVSSVGIRIKTRQAQISQAYHEFVSFDSGVIARHTQTDRYRLDIAEEIDEGNSWNLAVFLAHRLAHLQKLATVVEGDPSDLADVSSLIWATGEVDSDQKVHAVPEVHRKLVMSEALFKAAAQQGCPMTILLPDDAISDVVRNHLEQLTASFPKLTVRPLSTVSFDESSEIAAAPAANTPPAFESRQLRAWLAKPAVWGMLAAIVFIGLFSAFSDWQQVNGNGGDSPTSPVATVQSSSPPQVVVVWLQSTDGHCFENLSPGGSLALDWTEPLVIQTDARVCRLQFSVQASGRGELRAGAGGVQLASGRYNAKQSNPLEVGVYRLSGSHIQLTAQQAETTFTQIIKLP